VGLKAEWPKGTSVEVWPDPLPDLYAGEPVVLSAKVSSMNGELHFSGTFDGKPWTAALNISDAIDGAGVAKLWARSKIASLEAKAFADVDTTGIEKAIETVALEHHLVSSQTSLVAIDKTKSRPDGKGVASVDMPVNLPDGWVYDKVFGPPAQPMQKAMLNRQLQMNPTPPQLGSGASRNWAPSPSSGLLGFDGGSAPATEASEAYVQADQSADPALPADVTTLSSDAAPGVDPDQSPTITPSDADAGKAGQSYPLLPLTVVPKPDASPLAALKAAHGPSQRTALLALVLAFLSAVTFILWRYHRRDYASPRRIGRRI
jgi:hypothetical protein